MARNEVSILDIGSSKIRLVIGERGVNNTFNILGIGEADYSGYSNGEFLEPEQLKLAIGMAISNAETNSGLAVREVMVGVPAEFSVASVKNVNQNYPKKIKISQENIDDLFSKAVDETLIASNTLINCSPVYFILSDNRRLIDIIGEKTNRLSGLISCVYADNNFISLINSCLCEIGLDNCEYTSSPLCEAVYLTDCDERDRFALFVDCGYISTSVALVRGNGLLHLSSFSLGGGHISADLSSVLEIPFSVAESLKQKIVLSVSPDKNDFYELNINERTIKLPMDITNQVVCARIDNIASAINKCLLLCKQEYPEFIHVSLTGGGLAYIKGAKDYIAKSIGRNVKLVSPHDPQLGKPHLSSVLGLLDYTIKKSEQNKPTFIQKIKKTFLAKFSNR